MLTTIVVISGLATAAFFAVYRAPTWLWSIFMFGIAVLVWFGWIFYASIALFLLCAIFSILTVCFAALTIPSIRKSVLIRPVYRAVRKQKSRISNMEKQALTAGTAGFDKSLFSGRPNWAELRNLPKLDLPQEEQALLDGPVAEVCREIDDWDIRNNKREITDDVWNLVRERKLFALRVPKERGGLGVSFQTQSLVLGKVASRSVDAATMIELPTSLWPDEIIEKYGTESQKQYWMPRFAGNNEIASFAITGLSNGSDATSMRDVGYIEYRDVAGVRELGIRLNIAKRYITFAPKATVLVLGFQLMDPDEHLGKGKDIGISLAIFPSNQPGISIGRRHLPTGLAFPNGPIWGTDVFIPMDALIGGRERAGEGWRMIMECLFVGRAIALPSISVAACKVAARYSAEYARVRRQFGSHIGRFEGIEEPLAKIIEIAYVSESMRSLTASMVDTGSRPLAVSSLMKYRTTQMAREAIDAAMDIHAGRGVIDGPSNYLMSSFLAIPVGVTVEGANIVTRSIITFAQGVMQTHPYFYEELESCEEKNETAGLIRFDRALGGHISFFVSNMARAFLHNISGGFFAKAQSKVPARVAYWYRAIWRASVNFAAISDLTTIVIGPSLKKRQKLGGRLSDALSELFLLCATLKRYEGDGFPPEDMPIVELAMQNALWRFQEALKGAVRNFPVKTLRPFLQLLLFPFGGNRVSAPDILGHQAVELVLTPGPTLERLTRYIYISDDPEDITGRLEVAFKKSIAAEGPLKKLDLAIRQGKTKRILGADWVAEAEAQGALTADEAALVREAEALAEKALQVDHFDPADIRRAHSRIENV